MLTRAGLQSGQLLHLYGGHRAVQQQLALLMCKAACERGEYALFLNLGVPVSTGTLQRLGLYSFFSVSPGLTLRERVQRPFRLWAPPANPNRAPPADETLRQIKLAGVGAALNGQRLTIFVEHVERAFEPSPGASQTQRLSPPQVAGAYGTLDLWLEEIAVLCGETGTTVWLLHSGDEAAPRFRRGDAAPGDGWLRRLDVNERGEFVRRERKRRPEERPPSPSPFQKRVTALLCGDMETGKAEKGKATKTGTIASEKAPQLFGLEVSHPGLLFATSRCGARRFALWVQLWRGGARVEAVERLLINPAHQFDNNPDMWLPPLRPSSTKFLRSLPLYLGTTADDGADAFQETGMVEEVGAMMLGTPMLRLRK